MIAPYAGNAAHRDGERGSSYVERLQIVRRFDREAAACWALARTDSAGRLRNRRGEAGRALLAVIR